MGKHRDRMEQDLALRGLSSKTREGYLRYARAFVAYFGRSAEEPSAEHVRSWLQWLLQVQKRDAATVKVAIASLRFFHATLGPPEVMRDIRGVRKQHRAPDVLSGSEVERLLAATADIKHRAIFTLLCGAGLRVSEVLALRVVDIDGQRRARTQHQESTRPHSTFVAAHAPRADTARVLEGAPSQGRAFVPGPGWSQTIFA